METHALWGWVAIVVATFSYGSLFVPVKNYEIHDGLVYQWFQCCGILLSGLVQACWRNDWSASGFSAPGFYVCREGIMSGVFFQLANVLATQAVRTFGMSHYFTSQKVTNLGGAFVVGVFGGHLGLPVTAPGNPILALMGCLSVLLAMVPLSFTKVEEEQSANKCIQFEDIGSPTDPASPKDKKPHLIPPRHSDMGGYLMLDEAASEPSTPLVSPRSFRNSSAGSWCRGLTWSLTAGLAFSLIYIPLLPWKQRMALQNVKCSSFDYFLSIAVGLFISSTAYMLLGGAMRKYQGSRGMGYLFNALSFKMLVSLLINS
eukprot:Skav228329  [mRNA]  locus=scaffold4117:357849:358796:+ [translate_table: standard]